MALAVVIIVSIGVGLWLGRRAAYKDDPKTSPGPMSQEEQRQADIYDDEERGDGW